jgi:hypothetical protein
MSPPVHRKFAFAKVSLLGLRPQLAADIKDDAAADELAQTFSVALVSPDRPRSRSDRD